MNSDQRDRMTALEQAVWAACVATNALPGSTLVEVDRAISHADALVESVRHNLGVRQMKEKHDASTARHQIRLCGDAKNGFTYLCSCGARPHHTEGDPDEWMTLHLAIEGAAELPPDQANS